MSAAWYLVHAKTGQERVAEFNLRRQGYRTFLPAALKTTRHARRERIERTAFFPGYLFVMLDVERDRWRQIDSTIGVVRLITSMERPVPLPGTVVDPLIASSDREGVIDVSRHIGVGETIEIVRGPLTAQRGIVERLVGQDRIRVLLSLLGAKVAVDLDRTACEAA